MNEEDATEEVTPLDYIFSVEILNEAGSLLEERSKLGKHLRKH